MEEAEGLGCSHSITSSMALGWLVEGSDRGQGLGGRHLGWQRQVSQAKTWANQRKPPNSYLGMVSSRGEVGRNLERKGASKRSQD